MEQQKQDWIGFLTDFIKLIGKLGKKYSRGELMEEQVLDEVGPYFIEAHAFQEHHAELNKKMVSAFNELRRTIEEVNFRRENSEPSKRFKQYLKELTYRQHMIKMFKDHAQLWNTAIPWETRWWYNYAVEMQQHLH